MDSSVVMTSKHHVLLILVLFVNLYWLQGDALWNETDKIALIKLKEAITSDPNGVFNSWNGSIHFCEWYGITCGRRHERVTSIKFKGQGLVGTISPYIGNLTFLRLIYLRNNSIGGRIPLEIGNLSRLQYLRLTNNSFGGEIPANLSRCSQLKWIELGGNNLTGSIPIELGNSLAKIEVIELASNSLVGRIPPSFGNLSLLYFFSATNNYLVGGIPEELGQLTNLTYLYIGVNQLSGAIPRSLFNVTSIRDFFVTANRIEGSLPDNIGLTLPKLQYFVVGVNQMSGTIPSTLSNVSELVLIGLERNRFHGEVPTDIGRLGSLQQLLLSNNHLGSKSTKDLAFLTSLLNCSSLEILDLSSNQFGGVLPSSIGNLSVEMSKLYLGSNYFTGKVPASLSNLVNLVLLGMEQNKFSGDIHPSFGKFQKLLVLSLGDNKLSGQIPSSIGNNTQVLQLYLQQNKFEGSIPASIGNCGDLLLLDLSLNSLSGAIPGEVLSLSSLSQMLNLSHNSLQSLPAQVGKLMSISAIDISENNISGQIPASIGDCISLEYLYMQGNSFNGEIPSQISSLRGLQYLDLSRNNLTGEIPEYMQNLSSLQFLNLSYNDLQGEVPKSGVFGNASRISLVGNGEVCGGIADLHLQKCSTKATKQNMSRTLKLTIIIICVLLFVFLLIGMSAIFWLKRSKQVPASKSRTDVVDHHLRISYRDLYQATDGFSSRNLVGSGSFGSIYKGYLDQIKKSVAVKVLNLQQKGAAKSFMAETDALRNIRHRNLVKVITSCVSLDSQGNEFMALVYEFMENLSLEKWLYPEIDSEMGSKHLGLLQRLNIAIDVASALHYLHNLNEDTIVHRDLKPSNILLDGDMVAHVGDFGLARLLSTADGADRSETTTTGIKGTIGYAAPEYGMGWRASVEGDVYSYGIIVLEMFTGKRPTDEIFAYGSSLRDHVKAAIPKRLMHVVDPSLLPNAAPERNDTSRATTEELDSRNEIEVEVGSYYTKENPTDIKTNEQDCLLSLLELGVACSTESSKERMKMVDVVRELHKIKRSFLRV